MSAERLAAAHAKVAAAQSKFAEASRAVSAARSFAATAAAELIKHQRRNQEKADRRAAVLTRALKVGSAPTKLKAVPKIAEDHLKRLAAEHLSADATMALRALVDEEMSAQCEVDQAIAELHAAARSILAEEASSHVARIAELEREALLHRVQLEGATRSGTLGFVRQGGLSDLAKRIVRENEALPIGVRNAKEWASANEAAESWRQRFAFLIENPAPARAA